MPCYMVYFCLYAFSAFFLTRSLKAATALISTLLLIDADAIAECYTDSALDVNFSSVCLEILF